MKKWISRILILVCLVVFAYSAYQLIGYGLQTKRTQDNLNELSMMVNEGLTVDDSDKTPEERQADMMAKYGALYEENNDFIGWLKVEGTSIDYPVMYTPDDPQHYLRKNFDGDYDIAGMLFIDYRCQLDPEQMSTDTIIYGHRMKNDTMFAALGNYKEEDYVEAHKTVNFDTLYQSGTYEVFAVILSKAYNDNEDVFKYYDFVEAYTEEEFNTYLSEIQGLSIYYDEAAAPVWGDEILTLSTCDYYITDGRLAVICKRVGY